MAAVPFALNAASSGGRRAPGTLAFGSFVLALLLVGCTPVEKVSSKRSNTSSEHVDFDDLWVAAGYLCAGRTMPMLFKIEQVDTTLTAVSLIDSECAGYGDRVWRGTLPHAPIIRSQLPITFDVELTAAQGKPSARGKGTVASNDRMLLDVGAAPLIVTRAEAAVDELDMAAADGGKSKSDAGRAPVGAGERDAGVVVAASADAGSDGGPRAQTSQKPDAGGSAGSAGSESGAAGASTEPPSSSDWYCLSYQGSCTCVGDLGMSADMCNTPKPSCCFLLVAVGQPSCQCWPPDSEPCLTRETEAPGSTLVETCPPP